MTKYFTNTLDALMMASDLGEFTKKEWDRLTAGVATFSLRRLAQYGVFNIRKEQVGYKSREGRVFKIYDRATRKLLCNTTDSWFANKAESMMGCIIEDVREETKFPIYRYWYSINPVPMKAFFRNYAMREVDSLTIRIDGNRERIADLEQKIQSAEIERNTMALFLKMM